MAKSFKDVRKKSKNLDKLREEAEKAAGGKKDFTDSRFWKPTRSKDGNAKAVIRFLPESQHSDHLWVKVFNHSFNKKGKWFIENCPTTIGEECPVCEANRELYEDGGEDKKAIAQPRNRKQRFISNILVIEDPNNPDNDGKVFLYEFGKKVFDKIHEKLHPEFDDEKPVNIFDFDDGADFVLRVTGTGRDTNYDKSSFNDPGALSDDDKELESIWKQEYDLSEFIAEDKFKSYNELLKQFERVTNSSGNFKKNVEDDDSGEEEKEEDSKPSFKERMNKRKKSDDSDEDEVPWEEEDEKSTETEKESKEEDKKPKRRRKESSDEDDSDVEDFMKALEDEDD